MTCIHTCYDVHPTQPRVEAEERRQGCEERSHRPLAADDRLLVGLGKRADVHGHEQPRQGGKAALLGPRDLALSQPPFHAPERERHERGHDWRRRRRPRRRADALEPQGGFRCLVV